jgi:hypothetical protein
MRRLIRCAGERAGDIPAADLWVCISAGRIPGCFPGHRWLRRVRGLGRWEGGGDTRIHGSCAIGMCVVSGGQLYRRIVAAGEMLLGGRHRAELDVFGLNWCRREDVCSSGRGSGSSGRWVLEVGL